MCSHPIRWRARRLFPSTTDVHQTQRVRRILPVTQSILKVSLFHTFAPRLPPLIVSRLVSSGDPASVEVLQFLVVSKQLLLSHSLLSFTHAGALHHTGREAIIAILMLTSNPSFIVIRKNVVILRTILLELIHQVIGRRHNGTCKVFQTSVRPSRAQPSGQNWHV